MKKKSIQMIIYIIWVLLIVFSACNEENIFTKFSEGGFIEKIEVFGFGSSSE